jgi:predicted transcriptional regulator
MGRNRHSKKPGLPTAGEVRLLQVLWRIGQGTIDDILRASEEDPPPNYKTVQTWLRIMERKGQVGHKQRGRAFVFWPLIDRGVVHRLSLRHLLTRYFSGSRSDLLIELLSDEHITSEELRQLETLIRNRARQEHS